MPAHTLHKHAETICHRGRSRVVHVVSCTDCLMIDSESPWWQASTSRRRRDEMALEFDHVAQTERGDKMKVRIS